MTETVAPKKTDEKPKWIPWAIGIGLVVVAALAYFMLASSGAAVPDVVGMTAEEAEGAITEAGFEVGSVEETEAADVDAGTVVAQDPEAEVEADKGSKINLLVAAEDMTVKVPDVTGMTESEAKTALEAEGFTVEAVNHHVDKVEKGLVASQLPKAGEVVVPGSEVGIIVSLGKTPEGVKKVTVPDVTGMQEKDALSALAGAGLTIRTYYGNSDDVPQGAVIAQEPVGGTEVASSSTVAIHVSNGSSPKPPQPSTVKVPDVTGKTEAEATKTLSDAGLLAQVAPVFSSDVPAGNAIEQFPTAGTEVLAGSTVAVAISQGPETPSAVDVPDVVSMSSADAIKAIEAAGLKAIALTSATPDGQTADTVFAQLPQASAKVENGSPVLILVANGETGEIDPVPMR